MQTASVFLTVSMAIGDCQPSGTVQVYSVYSWLKSLPVVLTTLRVLQTLCTLAAWWPKCPTISRSVFGWRCLGSYHVYATVLMLHIYAHAIYIHSKRENFAVPAFLALKTLRKSCIIFYHIFINQSVLVIKIKQVCSQKGKMLVKYTILAPHTNLVSASRSFCVFLFNMIFETSDPVLLAFRMYGNIPYLLPMGWSRWSLAP